jgi:glyoxylase-like metal-dependent hydrolase (beta-lactamase superfamily II)
MDILAFFEKRTFTLTYLVSDPATGDALVIDPVLDFAAASATITTESADAVCAHLRKAGLRLHFVLETHAHADHLSASQTLIERFPGARIAIGDGIVDVQRTFKTIFDLPPEFPTDGSQFDRLLRDREVLDAGSLHVETIATPGHTPACVSYRIADAVFTGDALFMPDFGTGRCDFPDASASELYRSVTRRLYTLPAETRVFVGHDYQPNGRALRYETTIGEQKRSNVQLREGMSEDDFVRFRKARDATLGAPALLFPSVQVNIAGGRLPEPAPNGTRYLKIPLNLFRPEAGQGG